MLDKQMKIFQEGGMMDNSGEVVNGTEVPAGSLREEVADDIPARLSEGEFVIPADVVRFIGLEKLMKMRDAAKAGLERMQEMGQMGNAQEVANPDQKFSEPMMEDDSQFESDIDSIMQEVDQEEQMAKGGDVKKYAPGGVVTQDDPVAAAETSLENPSYSSAPISGFKMVKYYDKNGNIKYVPTINGQPLLTVPSGYTTKPVTVAEEEQAAEEPTETKKQTSTLDAGYDGNAGDGTGESGSNGSESGSSGDMGSGPTPTTGTVNALDIAMNSIMFGPVVGVAKAVTAALNHNPQNVPVTDAMLGLDVSNVGETGMGTNAQGQTVSNTDTIAQQNAQMFGVEPDDPNYGVAEPGNVPSGYMEDPAEDFGLTTGAAPGDAPGPSLGTPSVGAVTGDDATGPEGESGGGVGAGGDDGGAAAAASEGMSGEDGDFGGVWAKGGLIGKRKRPAKKQTRKGIAAKK